MVADFRPHDDVERRRIRDSLDETLFVEAGAGTGKTTSLVERLIALVSSGTTALPRIAAITFTEAAAAELRERVREQLEAAAAGPNLSDAERERCAQGVQDLDQASIQTLHGFAAALLMEKPLEAGLPPSFQVVDEIAGEIEFQEVWSAWLDKALDGSESVPRLPIALSLGLTPEHMRIIALRFHENYDLLDGPSLHDVSMPGPKIIRELVNAANELGRLCEYSMIGQSDAMYDHVQSKLGSIRRLSGMEADSMSAYRLLFGMLPLRQNSGRQADWAVDPRTGENACKYLKSWLSQLHERTEEELSAVRRSALMPLLRALKMLVLDYAADRKRQGRAGFHDLLVWARDLLSDDTAVREHFGRRFSHLLIDEVQDTDPLQAEIAMFLAESAEHTSQYGERPRNWEQIVPERGKLFVVGDPKQSIYRFRRADVRQMARLQQRMGGDTVRLVQNFRSQKPLIDWVNNLFEQWMSADRDQAEYVPLTHRWEAETGHPMGPRVWWLGEAVAGSIDPVRDRESKAISGLLRNLVADRWQVLDRDETDASGREVYRAARYADVCILMPRRTGLRVLELALDSTDVPYRLEGASLIFTTQEVRDLLNCLRAIDDPEDQVATVAALRSPAFSCTDVELLRFREAGGNFSCLSDASPADGAVASALKALAEYHRIRLWTSPASLIDRFIRDRLLMEAALDHPRTREQWRRYRFIVEQARAFAEAGGNTLRSFLGWTDRRAEEGARVTETPVPDRDEDAVRIMTVHGAKGLEFPIVVLTGINARDRRTAESVIFDRDSSGLEANVGPSGRSFKTSGYDAEIEEYNRMEAAERVRLLYVAATRARDHLVMSMYRQERTTSTASTIARLLDGRDDLWNRVTVTGPPSLPPPRSKLDVVDLKMHSLEAREQWRHDMKQLLRKQGHPSSVSATALDGQSEQEPGVEAIDADEPWRRGRAGTQVGRAVHAVLQTIDLVTGAGIDETARAQAAAEGIPNREADIARLARVAVKSDIVRRATASDRFWREVPAGVPVGDGVLQGFIDLLFEEDDGLVVVDYKTDSVEAHEVESAVSRYRLQAGSYALMAASATRKPVKEVIFLFLQPDREVTLTNVSQLAEAARSAAAAHLEGLGGAPDSRSVV